MKRRNVIRIISILLILVSIALFGFGKKNVLGFVIAEQQASQINYFVAAVLLIVGLILLTSEKLEQRVKNQRLFVEHHFREYRTHLEKSGDKNILAIPPYLRDKYAKDQLYKLSKEPTYSPETIKEIVKGIAKEYEDNNIELIDAVIEIDRVADIQPLDLEKAYLRPLRMTPQKFTIDSKKANQAISIPINDMNKKRALFYTLSTLVSVKKAEGLFPEDVSEKMIRSEAHISEQEAAKHHTTLFKKNIKENEEKYKKILEEYVKEKSIV